MALNSKMSVEVKVSPNSDLSVPYWTFSPDPYLPASITDEGTLRQRFTIGTAAETIPTTLFESIKMFLVKNNDPTNYVSLVFKNAAAATVTLQIAAGGFFATTDLDPSTSPTLQANSAAVICEVVAIGVG